MFTDKHFKLRISTIAIETVEGRRVAKTVPAGTVVKVLSRQVLATE
jgi:hypothetical protein